MSISVFTSSLYLSSSDVFRSATDRTTKLILMVNGSNDVFSQDEQPFGGHVITLPELWVRFPVTHSSSLLTQGD
jgi:hypothetical protein